MLMLMTEEESKELMSEMPPLVLENPVGPMKSSYSEVMKNFLSLISHFVKGEKSNTFIEEKLQDREAVSKLIKKELFKSNVFCGGFIPPMESDENNPTKINTDLFLEYWENLSKEQSFSYFTEMHGMLDYIWYEGNNLEAVRTLNVPNFYKDIPFKIAPNEVMPSDHLPMIAEFILK